MFFVVSPLISLYTTFVLTQLWNWFATAALHLDEISFWVMYGLVLIISTLKLNAGDVGDEYRDKAFATLLDACVPDDKKQAVSEEIEAQTQGLWFDIGLRIFLQTVGLSFTLTLGWAIHTFLV